MTVMASSPSPSKRLFVGNLFPEVTAADLEKLFNKFGSVSDVDIKTRRDIDGKAVSTFAFVGVAGMDDAGLRECIRQYNGLRWRRNSIRVQAAEEGFMQRLARERQENPAPQPQVPVADYDPMTMLKERRGERDLEAKTEKSGERIPERKPRSSALAMASAARDPEVTIERSKRFGEEETAAVDDGKVVAGLVCFADDDADDDAAEQGVKRRRIYNSSSSEDDEKPSKGVPLMPSSKKKKSQPKRSADFPKREKVQRFASPEKAASIVKVETRTSQFQATTASASSGSKPYPERKRYYSSSSDGDDDTNVKAERPAKSGSFLSKLKTFDSGVWQDSGDDDEEEIVKKERPKRAKKVPPTTTTTKAAEEDANQKRLASLRRKREESRKQQNIVKSSLVNVESGAKNKKIRFGDPQEEEVTSNAVAKKDDLFGEESDDEDDADAFKVRAQFEGKGGEKLLALQSRFHSDDRFRLDEKFKDGDDGVENVADDENGDEDVDDLEAERRRNLRVLESMGAGDKKSKKEKKRSVPFKDSSALRFDPERSGHREKFEVRKGGQKAQADDDAVDRPADIKETPMPEVAKDRSYSVASDVFKSGPNGGGGGGGGSSSDKSGFKFGFAGGDSGGGGGFSLLNQRDADGETYEAAAIEKDGKSRLDFLNENPFKYDSSSEDEEDEEKEKKPTGDDTFARKLAAKASAAASGSRASETFFFVPDDPRFAEGAEFLARSETTLDEIREKFEQERPVLAGILKKKLRSQAKKREKTAFGAAAAKDGDNQKRRRRWKDKNSSKKH